MFFYLERGTETAAVVSPFLKPMQLGYSAENDTVSAIAFILCSHYYEISSKW